MTNTKCHEVGEGRKYGMAGVDLLSDEIVSEQLTRYLFLLLLFFFFPEINLVSNVELLLNDSSWSSEI